MEISSPEACCSEDVEPKRSSFTCDNGADVRTIEKAIQWATGQTYVAKEGPMQEDGHSQPLWGATEPVAADMRAR